MGVCLKTALSRSVPWTLCNVLRCQHVTYPLRALSRLLKQAMALAVVTRKTNNSRTHPYLTWGGSVEKSCTCSMESLTAWCEGELAQEPRWDWGEAICALTPKPLTLSPKPRSPKLYSGDPTAHISNLTSRFTGLSH